MSTAKDIHQLSSEYNHVVLACGADIKRIWGGIMHSQAPTPVVLEEEASLSTPVVEEASPASPASSSSSPASPASSSSSPASSSPVSCSLNVKLVRGQNILIDYQASSTFSSLDNPSYLNSSSLDNPLYLKTYLKSAVICGEYIVPRGDSTLVCGATHEHLTAEQVTS